MRPSDDTYRGHIRTESDRFLAVLRDADPRLKVPSCPDWDAGDLLWHLAKVQWFWGSILLEKAQDPSALDDPERPVEHTELATFFAEATSRLTAAAADSDPTTTVWTWSPDHTAAFIIRRQAHEALIHRLDAELAVGEVTPLGPVLAGDGIEEILEVVYGGCPAWGTFTEDGSRLALETTDTGKRVSVALGRFTGTDPADDTTYDEDDLSVVDDGADTSADAIISGTADDIDAWLWHRRSEDILTFDGDQATLDRFRTIITQPVN